MIKLFFVIIFLFSQFTFSLSQGVWTQKAKLPASPRYDGVGFAIDTKGYILGGNDCNSNVTDFWEYEPSANSWSQKPNFNGGKIYQAVAFVIGLKGYIVLGTDSNKLWEYDSSNDSWTQKTILPGPSNRNTLIGFSIGSKGYIGGGYSGIPSIWYKDFWEYDPTLNSWTQKSDYPGKGRGYNFSLSIGTKGYVGTGRDSTWGFFDDFWEYNPLTNIWVQKTNFPGGLRADIDGAHFTISGYGYIGTGIDGTTYCNDFWRYNQTNDSWIQIPNSPSARVGAVGFSINSKGYIGLGFGSSNTCLNDLWEYDTTNIGINENNFEDYFSVYPNPTNGKFSIKNDKLIIKNIEVYNVHGKKVYFSNKPDIDLSTQTNGIYFVHVFSKEGTEIKEVIIIK